MCLSVLCKAYARLLKKKHNSMRLSQDQQQKGTESLVHPDQQRLDQQFLSSFPCRTPSRKEIVIEKSSLQCQTAVDLAISVHRPPNPHRRLHVSSNPTCLHQYGAEQPLVSTSCEVTGEFTAVPPLPPTIVSFLHVMAYEARLGRFHSRKPHHLLWFQYQRLTQT